VHKSKGLEFPVVFCPFGWDGSEIRNSREPFVFHAGETTAGLTLDLGSEGMEENRKLAERELLSENLRLLYVSLTRARARTYFVWGRFKSAETSAPAYLLHPPGTAKEKEPVVEERVRHGNLEGLARRAGGAIFLDRIQGKGKEVPPLPPSTEQTDFSCRTFRGRVERDWGVASFSSLTSLHPRSAEPTDRDQVETPPPLMREGEEPRGFFSFPAGVRTGGFLHGLFEELDFTVDDKTARRALVLEKLLEYGFDPVWEDGVDAMLDRVLNADLDPGSPALRLCRVKAEDRLNELEFYFPLKRVTPGRLRELLSEFGAADGLPPEFAENIGELVFSPVRGYMRGFIDLLFHHEGRYFVVDWKSHDLGPVIEDYGPRELARAMKEGVYTFQALIYAVAAHRYLKLRLGGYRFDTHFGGIFYLFVRGMDPAGDHGICRVKPSEALLDRLAAELIDG
jgi:exodeoxyribonuclease V beta subunit